MVCYYFHYRPIRENRCFVWLFLLHRERKKGKICFHSYPRTVRPKNAELRYSQASIWGNQRGARRKRGHAGVVNKMYGTYSFSKALPAVVTPKEHIPAPIRKAVKVDFS